MPPPPFPYSTGVNQVTFGIIRNKQLEMCPPTYHGTFMFQSLVALSLKLPANHIHILYIYINSIARLKLQVHQNMIQK